MVCLIVYITLLDFDSIGLAMIPALYTEIKEVNDIIKAQFKEITQNDAKRS